MDKFSQTGLGGFKIEENLSNVKEKSVWSFKNLVKKKAHEYEYNQLMNMKRSHSKLSDLHYTKLETQNYLKTLNKPEAQTLFSYRVRMANYGENYRGLKNTTLCPLCKTHRDSQQMGFENCPVLRRNITISGRYKQIFETSVPSDVIQTLIKIEKLREEYLKTLSQDEANSTIQYDICMGASDNNTYYQN